MQLFGPWWPYGIDLMAVQKILKTFTLGTYICLTACLSCIKSTPHLTTQSHPSAKGLIAEHYSSSKSNPQPSLSSGSFSI